MKIPNVTIKALDNPTVTVTVRLARRFTARLRVGLWLIKLGAKVMPIPVKVDAR